MKIPDVFIPEKNLEEKTEKLLDNYREVTTEELMENNMWIIHGDTKPVEQLIGNLERIGSKILKDTVSGKIRWKEDIVPNTDYLKCYTAKTTIPNYRQEPMIVPVSFLISKSLTGEKFGDLFLGDEKGFKLIPFVKYEKVRQVFKEYFK